MHRRSLLGSLFLLAALAACNAAPNTAGQISERIGEIANDPTSREVDLTKLTSFGWDRLFMFKAGTTRDEICQFLKANRNTCGRVVRYESVPSGHTAILFVLGYQLTHIELHALANGEFDIDPGPSGLPRSSCVFKVRHVASTGAAPVAHLEPK
jgi:hypothetical protein